MTVFVDTSAFLAILMEDDVKHPAAKRVWHTLVEQDELLVCTNYVVVETMALLQNRLGMIAVKTFEEDIVPLLQRVWIDEATHHAGITALLTANRRQLSLVDCVSFEVARRRGIDTVFAFDRHFSEQGFICLA